jgi:hypothetical protein
MSTAARYSREARLIRPGAAISHPGARAGGKENHDA